MISTLRRFTIFLFYSTASTICSTLPGRVWHPSTDYGKQIYSPVCWSACVHDDREWERDALRRYRNFLQATKIFISTTSVVTIARSGILPLTRGGKRTGGCALEELRAFAWEQR